MEEIGSRVMSARRRISALVVIARCTWVANLFVGIAGFVCHRYELAAVAGYTSLMALFVAACARRAARHLNSAERVIVSNQRHSSKAAIDTLSQEAIY